MFKRYKKDNNNPLQGLVSYINQAVDRRIATINNRTDVGESQSQQSTPSGSAESVASGGRSVNALTYNDQQEYRRIKAKLMSQKQGFRKIYNATLSALHRLYRRVLAGTITRTEFLNGILKIDSALDEHALEGTEDITPTPINFKHK